MCYGVLLHEWDGNTFVGDVVGIVKEAIEKSFLEYGQLCLQVNHCFIYECSGNGGI